MCRSSSLRCLPSLSGNIMRAPLDPFSVMSAGANSWQSSISRATSAWTHEHCSAPQLCGHWAFKVTSSLPATASSQCHKEKPLLLSVGQAARTEVIWRKNMKSTLQPPALVRAEIPLTSLGQTTVETLLHRSTMPGRVHTGDQKSF